jgi:hypothetical protein
MDTADPAWLVMVRKLTFCTHVREADHLRLLNSFSHAPSCHF